MLVLLSRHRLPAFCPRLPLAAHVCPRLPLAAYVCRRLRVARNELTPEVVADRMLWLSAPRMCVWKNVSSM
jgi:hypothetical protein